jgi:hypothetical protein
MTTNNQNYEQFMQTMKAKEPDCYAGMTYGQRNYIGSKASGVYMEQHHINPKSAEGDTDNSDSNIVALTPTDHLIAHLLLWQQDKSNSSNAAAFLMMVNTNDWDNVTDIEQHRAEIDEARSVWAEAHSKRTKEFYAANPEAREAKSKRFKEFYADPANREAQSKRTKEFYADPANREAKSKSLKEFYSNNPEAREANSKRGKEFFADPANREAQSKRGKEFWSDPALLQKRTEAQKLSKIFHMLYCKIENITKAGSNYRNLSTDTKHHIKRSRDTFAACGGDISGQEVFIDMYLKPIKIPLKQLKPFMKQFCASIGLTKVGGGGFANMPREAFYEWLKPSIRQLYQQEYGVATNGQYHFYL